ncbi:MAG TPA: hypothetical protein VF365_03510 [Candidatus Limnocylindria bacterium]
MTRTNRIALLAALALIVAATGTVLATRAPQAPQQAAGPQADEAEQADGPPSAEAIARAAARLADLGINADTLGDYAERYGLGGAVRLHAWADATGMPVQDIADLRDGDGETPMGWGRLAKQLGVNPGIGWVMGNGRGAGDPPGQERKAGD